MTMFKWFVLVLPILLLLGAIAAGAANAMPGVQTPTPAADLSISKTDSPDPVALGKNLTYTVTVTNHGPQAATGVTLTDILLGSFTLVLATPTQGSCGGTNPITCNLGNLAAGASATVTIMATPTREGDIINIALVNGAEPDSMLMNNLATEKARVKAVKLEDTQGKIEFRGFVQSLPQAGQLGTWRVQGLAVNVTGSTEIKGAPQVGSFVKVEGTLTAEGTIQGKELKAEKRDQGVRNLDDDHRPGRGLGDHNHSHKRPPGLDQDDDHRPRQGLGRPQSQTRQSARPRSRR